MTERMSRIDFLPFLRFYTFSAPYFVIAVAAVIRPLREKIPLSRRLIL